MNTNSRIVAIALVAAVSMPVVAQDILQSRGKDQRLDYRSLTRFGPWDDRNYELSIEDLEWFSPNEEDLYPGIPAFFRIELRKEWPHLMRTGPAQYPRAALQVFRLRYGGLMRNGVIARRANAGPSRTPTTVDGQLRLNDVLNADEITVEINPVFPLKVIAGSNSSGAAFGQKMYYSADGGVTWNIADDGNSNGILDNTCCDPTVAWSSDGTIAYASALSTAIGVNFYRSTDFGASWSLSKVITPSGSDKEFVHVDISPTSSHKDFIYLTYHNGNTMQFARSTDMGLNFTTLAFGSEPNGIGSDITTDSAGNIYYLYASFGRTVTLLKSTNGGLSFGLPVTVATTNAEFDWPIPSMEARRAWKYVAADADRSGGPFDGNIYAAWTDTSAADSDFDPNANHTRIVVARSADGGATWQTSIPHPTGDIETVDRFNQWMTVDGHGIVHVVYYNTMNSVDRTGVDLYYANSDDGGVTWNAEERISTVTSINVTNGQEWGDYNGISVINGQIVTTWTDNRAFLPTFPNFPESTNVFAGRMTLEIVDMSTVWVDFGFTGTKTGSETNPFDTLSAAVMAVDTGGVVNIKGNTGTPTTTETATILKAMTLQAVGGTVQIGVP